MTCPSQWAIVQRLRAGRSRSSVTLARKGYILLELVIALSIFAIAVLGLARALNNTLEAANMINKDYAVRLAMRSFLEEVRRKPLPEMATTAKDERLDLTLTSSVKPIEGLRFGNNPLSDLHEIKITADYTASGKPQQEVIRVWVYQTAKETERRQRR